MSIVTGTVSNGITLGQAGFTSPLLVTHTGAVSNSTGAAVYASGTYLIRSSSTRGRSWIRAPSPRSA